MEEIRESIEIAASPEAVFAVVADLCRRAALNPHWTVIACGCLQEHEMKIGARCRLVLRRGDTRIEHVSRVAVYDPPYRLTLYSDTHPGIEITHTVFAVPGGCVLTHTERFPSPPPAPVVPPVPGGFWGRVLQALLVMEVAGAFPQAQAEVQARLHQQMQAELRDWLVAIQRAVEGFQADSTPGDTAAPGVPTRTSTG